MWSLEIVSRGEIVAEYEGVAIEQRNDFYVGGVMVSGFKALDGNAEVIERVAGRGPGLPPVVSFEEDFVCIKGLWLHQDPDSIGSFSYGVRDIHGFRALDELDGRRDNPALQRQWNLRLAMEASGFVASAQALAVAETPAPAFAMA